MCNTGPIPEPAYTRKSEKESICMCCFSTVRADRYTTLDIAEAIHSEVCLTGDRSPLAQRLRDAFS